MRKTPAEFTQPSGQSKAAPPTDDQDVVELLHAIDFGEQLVHHGVVHAGAAGHAAPLLADGINLIKNDDVHPTVGSELWERGRVRNVTGLTAESNPEPTVTSHQAQPHRHSADTPCVLRITHVCVCVCVSHPFQGEHPAPSPNQRVWGALPKLRTLQPHRFQGRARG